MHMARWHEAHTRLVAVENRGTLVGPIALQRRWGCCVLVALALSVAACGPAPLPPAAVAAPEWREFEGSLNAAGSRRTIPLGAGRRGSIVDLRGTLLLEGPGRPGVGFRAEVIALVDSETGLEGRGVWTDERGEQVFTTLKGEGTAARNRIAGEILGGTGRFAGATGSYEFSWQFVLEAEDGAVQGRAVGLKGRILLAPPTPGTARP
jgi:predicted small lipoprotein YifL